MPTNRAKPKDLDLTETVGNAQTVSIDGVEFRVSVVDLDKLAQDDQNANRGTERGAAMVDSSISQAGWGRSLTVDRNGRIISGNHSHEAATRAGLSKAVLLHTAGNVVVGHAREDLDLTTDEAARVLAIADNRASELGLDWNPEILDGFAEKFDLGAFFTANDLAALKGSGGEGGDGGSGGGEEDPPGLNDSGKTYENKYAVAVSCADEAEQQRVYDELTQKGYECKVMVI